MIPNSVLSDLNLMYYEQRIFDRVVEGSAVPVIRDVPQIVSTPPLVPATPQMIPATPIAASPPSTPEGEEESQRIVRDYLNRAIKAEEALALALARIHVLEEERDKIRDDFRKQNARTFQRLYPPPTSHVDVLQRISKTIDILCVGSEDSVPAVVFAKASQMQPDPDAVTLGIVGGSKDVIFARFRKTYRDTAKNLEGWSRKLLSSPHARYPWAIPPTLHSATPGEFLYWTGEDKCIYNLMRVYPLGTRHIVAVVPDMPSKSWGVTVGRVSRVVDGHLAGITVVRTVFLDLPTKIVGAYGVPQTEPSIFGYSFELLLSCTRDGIEELSLVKSVYDLGGTLNSWGATE